MNSRHNSVFDIFRHPTTALIFAIYLIHAPFSNAVAAQPGQCNGILGSLILDGMGKNILTTHTLRGLLSYSHEYEDFVQNGKEGQCTYNCITPTGNASLGIEIVRQGHRKYPILLSGNNSHKFQDSDPIFGKVSVSLVESTVGSKDPNADPFQLHYDFENASSEIGGGIGTYARSFLNPRFLQALAYMLEHRPSSADDGTLNLSTERNSKDTLSDMSNESQYQTLFAALANNPRANLPFIFPTYFREVTKYNIDGPNKKVVFADTSGMGAVLTFTQSNQGTIIKTLHVQYQVGRAQIVIDVNFEDGNILKAIQAYENHQQNLIAANDRKEAKKLEKAQRERSLSEGQYTTTPHPANPDGKIGGNVFNELVIFTVSPEKKVVKGVLTFRMADFPRPSVLVVAGKSYRIDYMRDGIMTFGNGAPLIGSYVKQKIKNLEGQVTEEMIDVTLRLPDDSPSPMTALPR